MDAFLCPWRMVLNEPHMKKRKMLGIAGTFGVFRGVDADGRVDMCPYDRRIFFSI